MIGSRGSLGPQTSYRVELVHQTGEGLSNSFNAIGLPTTQTMEDIEAWAGSLSLNRFLRDEYDTRFDFELHLFF